MCKPTPAAKSRKGNAPTKDQDFKLPQGVKIQPNEAVDLPFTLTEIKSKIPKECFEKSLAKSMFYAMRDWAVVFALLYFKTTIFEYGFFAKFLWWNVLGFWGWCLFVIGHDCGHGSFSTNPQINFLMGHICHAPLCVPFFGWAKSHSEHHQYHNHVDKDHSWRPFSKSDFETSDTVTKFARFTPFLLLLYPIYLLRESTECGFSGNHFNPFSPMFAENERKRAAISSLSVVGWVYFLFKYFDGDYSNMLQTYVIPYFIFSAWLSLVTYLQHTDEKAYYFSNASWSYLRGALSTIDRTYKAIIDPFDLGYGHILDDIHHNISNGHVAHHIFFTSIPHYNLLKATEAIKPVLGKHYMYDDTPIPKAFWKSVQKCVFVDTTNGEDVVMYRDSEGKGNGERISLKI